MKKYIKADISSLSEESTLTRMAVASDPATAPRVLVRLADDPKYIVRYLVSKNPSTPAGVITEDFSDYDLIEHYDEAIAFDLEGFDYGPPAHDRQQHISNIITNMLEEEGFRVTDCHWSMRDDEDDEDDDSHVEFYSIYVYWNGYDTVDFALATPLVKKIKNYLNSSCDDIYIEWIELF